MQSGFPLTRPANRFERQDRAARRASQTAPFSSGSKFFGNKSPSRLFNERKRRREMRRQSDVNLFEAKIVSPQGIALNGSGSAIFREQSSCFSVQVPVGFLRDWRERAGGYLAHVWLLRRDGTSVPQCAEPFVFSLGTCGEHATDYEFYAFSKIPADELASVVVSCHGRLYCHEIRKASEPRKLTASGAENQRTV